MTVIVKVPTRAEIIRQLRYEIETYESSYRESDGRITDTDALEAIARLKAAIIILKEKAPCRPSRSGSRSSSTTSTRA